MKPTVECEENLNPAVLLQAGRIQAAKTALGDRVDAEALIVRAQIALFENDLDAVEQFADRASTEGVTEGERAMGRVLVACAAGSRQRPFTLGLSDISGVERERMDEVIYYAALAWYMANDYARAEFWLDSHAPTSVAMRARYLSLRGNIGGAQEDYVYQAECADAGLALLVANAPDHTYLLGVHAQTLAVLMREGIKVPRRAAKCLERVATMLTEDQTGARMQIYRALGWTRAVAGDVEGALKHVLRSATLAQTPAQRVYAGLDHASIALFAGERSGSARAAYSLALETADAITWSDIRSDDLAALPLLVLVAALLGDEKSARRYCSMARKCVGQISGRFALKHDKRFMAMLDEAEALTLRGSHNEILRLGKSSYAVFSRIGYVWRAARMAAYLFQRTHDARWEKKATAHLRGIVAGSPLHGVLAEAKRICGLPARPKQVLELVCERRTDDQIAELLGMKPNTVRVHLNRIYRYFGVRGRLALYARLAS